MPDADLSDTANEVAFQIDGLSLDPAAPLPDEGDPVLAEGVGDGILTCVEVDLSEGDVSDVLITLNALAMPAG